MRTYRRRRGETDEAFRERIHRKHSRFPFRWSLNIAGWSIGCQWAHHVSWGSAIWRVWRFGDWNFYLADMRRRSL